MSYVLEAILIPNKPCNKELFTDMEFDRESLNENVAILSRPGRVVFSEIAIRVAQTLSTELGISLHIRWDDRVGFTETRVFRSGALTDCFTNQDELYVMVDEDFKPILDGEKYPESMLDSFNDDVDFEIFESALEMGCKASGLLDWESLKDFMGI